MIGPEYQRNWYSQNAERGREHSRKYRRNHPDSTREYHSEYNRSDRGKERLKSYNKQHPEKNANRRGLAKHAGTYTLQEWQYLKGIYNYTCLCCGRQEPDIKLTPDHVIPLSRGGGNTIENIQPLCLDCNRRKGAKKTDYR